VSEATKRDHLSMRLRSPHLVATGVAAAAVVGLLVASSASAVTAPRTVALHVTVNGSGTVRVPGNPAFTCHASFPTSSHCRATFYVRKGRRIVIREAPASGWKLWRWTGACHGSAANCSLRVKARRFGFVTASFVPPGDRLNPYSLATTATLDEYPGNWRLKVNSATINADSEVEAVPDPYGGGPANGPPPAGAQYTLVNVSATYVGGGSDSLSGFLSNVQAEGAGNAVYRRSCIPPSPDLSDAPDQVFSGTTVTGNLCFTIASNDAATLMLRVDTLVSNAFVTIWFKLG
jgi:hypothetical protein